jgi:hypothetical protein
MTGPTAADTGMVGRANETKSDATGPGRQRPRHRRRSVWRTRLSQLLRREAPGRRGEPGRPGEPGRWGEPLGRGEPGASIKGG